MAAQLPVKPQLPDLPETLSLLADLGLTEVALERILVAYAPAFFLWPQERFLPCSVEWYLANCYAVRTEHGKDGSKQRVVVIPEGQVTPEKLHELERKSALGSHPPSLWMAPDKWPGQSGVALEETPIYAHAKVLCSRTPARRPLAIEINYTTIWAYNGSYNLCGCPCFKVGEHVGDVEHVTVRLALRKRTAADADPLPPDTPSSKYTIRFSGVWYNSHSNKEGEWRQARRVPLDPVSSRVAVFVADHSHGFYPSPGVIRRIFGAANDVTSGDGPVWRPKRVVRMLGLGYSGDRIPTADSRGCSFRETDDDTLPLKLSQRPDPSAAAIKAPPPLAPGVAPPLVPAASPVKPSHDSATTAAAYHALPPIKATGGNDSWPPTLVPPALTSAAPSQEGPCPPLIKGQLLPAAPGTAAAAGGVVAHLGSSPKGHAGAEPLQDGPWYEPVLMRDLGAWQLAKASYGTADAPAQHGWFRSAEPPVSRTFIQRWLTPWVDGVDSLPDPQDDPHDDATNSKAAGVP